MEELKKNIEKDIQKYIISARKPNISKGQRNYMQGMIDASNRILYNIELNYSILTYKQINEENALKYRNK